MSGSAYAFFVQFHEQAARWCIRLRVLSQCPMRMKPNATMKTIDYITKKEFLRANPHYKRGRLMQFNYALLCIVGSVLFLLPLMEVVGYPCSDAVNLLVCAVFVIFPILGLSSLLFVDCLRGVSLVELTESEYKVVGDGGRFGLYRFHENRIDVFAKVEYDMVALVGCNMYEFSSGGKKSLLYLGAYPPVWIHDIDENVTFSDEKDLYIVEKATGQRR